MNSEISIFNKFSKTAAAAAAAAKGPLLKRREKRNQPLSH